MSFSEGLSPRPPLSPAGSAGDSPTFGRRTTLAASAYDGFDDANPFADLESSRYIPPLPSPAREALERPPSEPAASPAAMGSFEPPLAIPPDSPDEPTPLAGSPIVPEKLLPQPSAVAPAVPDKALADLTTVGSPVVPEKLSTLTLDDVASGPPVLPPSVRTDPPRATASPVTSLSAPNPLQGAEGPASDEGEDFGAPALTPAFDRVLVSPLGSGPPVFDPAGSEVPPLPASSSAPRIHTPLQAPLPVSSGPLSRTSSAGEAASIRTVALDDGDRGSVRTVESQTAAEAVNGAGSASQPMASGGSAASSSAAAPARSAPTYSITVGDPQKIGSELTGNAHTVYTIRTRVAPQAVATASARFRKADFSVLRRYNDFLWLYEALQANNPGVLIPPPPEKTAFGRFDSNFVQQRRVGLQTCLQKTVNHPLLASDPDLRLFLESDTFSLDIRHRKAELASEKTGLLAGLSSSFMGPRFVEFDEFFDVRKGMVDALEPQLKSLNVALSNAAKARVAIAGSSQELSAAASTVLASGGVVIRPPLKEALHALAGLKRRLGDLVEEQGRAEESENGLFATVDAYLRLCNSYRLALASRIKTYHTWQKTLATVKTARTTHEKAKSRRSQPVAPYSNMPSESVNAAVAAVTDAERRAEAAKRDFDDVSTLLRTESVRFDAEKVEDFKDAVCAYVDDMARRQAEVVRAWEIYASILERCFAAVRPEPPAPSATDAAQAAPPVQP